MKSALGHHAFCKATSESGLVLGEINENNLGWKAQFSYDNKVLIERLNIDDLNIGERKSDETLLERLCRDINSNILQTRQWASELLCYFIEEGGEDVHLELLKDSIDKMVSRISIEEDYDVGQRLSEGIFEFICLKKLVKSDELSLVTRLAKMNKDYLHPYLDDEEYLQIDEVKEFVLDKSKWWNTGS